MNKYNIEQKDGSISIKINGLIHLTFRQNELIGIQSWIAGDKRKKYCIEFVFKTNSFISEYNEYKKWEKILNLICNFPIMTDNFDK